MWIVKTTKNEFFISLDSSAVLDVPLFKQNWIFLCQASPSNLQQKPTGYNQSTTTLHLKYFSKYSLPIPSILISYTTNLTF